MTNAAGTILQVAVSLDYSVFLIHRFEECKMKITDSKEAMVDACASPTSSILSSGLTTVIGFLALVFMRFRIGPDLGLALAKGVAISLITVFTFMPVLILATQKWLQKSQHRSFLPGFHGFGRVVYRVMIPLICVFVVLIVPVIWHPTPMIFTTVRLKFMGIQHNMDRIRRPLRNVRQE